MLSFLAKPMELHKSQFVWKRDNFVLRCSKLTGCFTACMGMYFPVVELDNKIWFKIVSGPSVGVRDPVA